MEQPPVPEPRDLLPPLLACLPTTFLSASPSPALLPLLAPILRQRVAFLGGSNSTNSDGWARLLCWDAQHGARLPSVIEKLDLEPHPVSGEVEIEDVEAVDYRRLDDETLYARLRVDQFNLAPIYVWCRDDDHGQTGPGWKLTELRALEDVQDGVMWYESIAEANSALMSVVGLATAPKISPHPTTSTQDENDDNYWAAYDQTPAQTPALKQPPAPHVALNAPSSRLQTEEDYYSRYGAEVQPAMDAHDPDEEHAEIGDSTLEGSQQRARRPISLEITAAEDDRPAWQKALYPHVPKARTAYDSAIATSLSQSVHSELNMPRPISPASSTRSVEKLEEQAAAMTDDSASASRFTLGTKQHISTGIKSLFRLAKTAGMSRADFEELIRRELDVLSLLDDDNE